MTQEQLQQLSGPDVLRMVAEYDPSWELVASPLKSRARVSHYRIGVPGARPMGEPTQP